MALGSDKAHRRPRGKHLKIIREQAPLLGDSDQRQLNQLQNIVGACWPYIAPIKPGAILIVWTKIFRRTDGDHVFAISRCADNTARGSAIAGGEDEDHLLAARLGQIRVAHTRIKGLGESS